MVTLKFLETIHSYPNIYRQRALDEKGSRTKKKLGFTTNLKTRPIILDHLRRLLREELLPLRSIQTIDQLQTFVVHSNGKEAAQSGSHDDRVMSLAIACFMCHEFPTEKYGEDYGVYSDRGERLSKRELYIPA